MDDRTRPLAMPDRARTLAEGEHVGAWVTARVLASGGFGTVYRVRHAHTGERAALKLLHAHLVTSAETLARFDREIRVIGALAHPNVVRLVDAGFSGEGQPYLCMELLEGRDLAQRIDRDGRLAVAQAIEILEPVCEALASAHQLGIVHRDIKSANVMLCDDGRVVLLDFGIAKISDALAPELTATNQSLGTPSSMAPEQIHGGRPDERTDVYALGALLFHMVTGRLPFSDPSATMTQYLHLHASRPRASRVSEDIPERFDDVIARAMAIEPAERYPDVRALFVAALAASRETQVVRVVAVVETVAVFVAVVDRTGGTVLESALLEDLEAVLPAAERWLGERGFVLAVDLGSSAVFVAPRARVDAPAVLANELLAELGTRPHPDARVQIGVAVHVDDAPFAGTDIGACELLQLATWGVPEPLDGVWISPSISGH